MYHLKTRKSDILSYIFLFFMSVLVSSPLIFVLIKASHSITEAFSSKMTFGSSLFINIKTAWNSTHLSRYFFNTLTFSVTVTLVKLITSFMMASALVFFKLRLKKTLFFIVVFTMMLPTESLFLGLYDLISLPPNKNLFVAFLTILNPLSYLIPLKNGLGLNNSFLGLIIPFLSSATAIFIFRQSFLKMNMDYIDAAVLDGCGPWRTLIHVVAPLNANIIGSLAAVFMISSWNQYLWPRIIIQDEQKQLSQVGLNALLGATDYHHMGVIMASILLMMLPSFLFFYIMQHFIMKSFRSLSV